MTNHTTPAISTKSINHGFSVYLDLLRWGAACMVLLFHVKYYSLGPQGLLTYIPSRGHDFVIVFFVLSGYVISATADNKKHLGFRTYALDRISRIYSVAIPILIFCSLMALIFHFADPDRFSHKENVLVILKTFFINTFFMGEIWFNRNGILLNDPYWSLCYEVLYYFGFGFFFFFSGWKRTFGLLAFALIAGPKILILMPCWLIGCLIYFKRDAVKLAPGIAVLVAFVAPIIIAIIFHAVRFGDFYGAMSIELLGEYSERFNYSKNFLIDWASALIIAMQIYAVRYLLISWPKAIERVIALGSSMSFTLYLMHQPLLWLLIVYGKTVNRSVVFIIATLGVTFVCYLISLLTESRKSDLRKLLDTWLPTGKFGGYR